MAAEVSKWTITTTLKFVSAAECERFYENYVEPYEPHAYVGLIFEHVQSTRSRRKTVIECAFGGTEAQLQAKVAELSGQMDAVGASARGRRKRDGSGDDSPIKSCKIVSAKSELQKKPKKEPGRTKSEQGNVVSNSGTASKSNVQVPRPPRWAMTTRFTFDDATDCENFHRNYIGKFESNNEFLDIACLEVRSEVSGRHCTVKALLELPLPEARNLSDVIRRRVDGIGDQIAHQRRLLGIPGGNPIKSCQIEIHRPERNMVRLAVFVIFLGIVFFSLYRNDFKIPYWERLKQEADPAATSPKQDDKSSTNSTSRTPKSAPN